MAIKWLFNEGTRYLILVIWLSINGALFGLTFAKFAYGDQYFYLREIVGNSLAWARSSAMCLNFNCMLLLLPVCRNLISHLRGMCTCCRPGLRRQLDNHVAFHILLAYTICVFTVIHIAAHCFNLERFLDAQKSENGLLTTLSNPQLSSNKSYISVNPLANSDSDASVELFKSLAGISGVIMTLILIILLSSATFIIRRSSFEVFYYTHHLFVVFYICLVIHGCGGLIRDQVNLKQNDPKQCSKSDKYEKWGTDPQCAIPWFAGSYPQTWKWVVGPIVVYVIERVLRRYRAAQTVTVSKVVSHPSSVFELRMQKSNFTSKPGEYILVNCPKISWLEWHPFTLTSAPEDEFFSIHIRRVGDWTNSLAKSCHVDDQGVEVAWKLPRICVDGPFGAPCEDFFNYDVDVLIGTGIGITPFASILKHIWYRIQGRRSEFGLKKVYVIWICREMNMFEWFHDLLHFLETQLSSQGEAEFLEYSVFLTRGWDTDQARNIILHSEERADAITGLRQKTQFGRPQWDNIFSDLVQNHANTKIGVFFCGSAELSKDLKKRCMQHSVGHGGTRFFFNKEHF